MWWIIAILIGLWSIGIIIVGVIASAIISNQNFISKRNDEDEGDE